MKLLKLPTTLLLLLAAMALFGTIKCFGQDSTKVKKVLVIERTTTDRWNPLPEREIFKQGKKIQVVIKNYSMPMIDRLEIINDSVISLEGDKILLSDIASIKKCRGKLTFIASGSVAVVIAGLLTLSAGGYYGGIFINSTSISIVALAASTIATLVGGIQWATAKNYHIDGSWKISVEHYVPENPGMMKFPGRSNNNLPGNVFPTPNKTKMMPNPFPVKKKKEKDK